MEVERGFILATSWFELKSCKKLKVKQINNQLPNLFFYFVDMMMCSFDWHLLISPCGNNTNDYTHGCACCCSRNDDMV